MSWTQLWPRRLVGTLGAAVNALAQTKPAIALNVVARLIIAGGASPAIAFALAPLVVLAGYVTSGLSLVWSATGSLLAATTPGVYLSTVLGLQSAQATPAFDLVQMTVSLTHRRGAATATSTTSSGSWTNAANAAGDPNGTTATHAGSATANHSTRLGFTFDDLTNKDSLAIQSVKLHFYVQQSGTALNNGDLRLYRGDATGFEVAQLEQITGNVNNLAAPRTFDVTANYPTWASLNALQAGVRHLTDLGEIGVTAAVDAVEVEVVATRTDAL